MSRSRQNSDSKYSTGDAKIVEGERVLCYHGSLMYEAKCLKIRDCEKEPSKVEYFIHYAGWSKKWEEWVGESRVLKYTEENVKKQQSLVDEGKQTKKTPGRKSSTTEKDKDSGNSRPCSPAVSIKSNKSNQDTSGKDDFEPEPKKKKSMAKEKIKEKEKPKEKIIKEKEKDKEIVEEENKSEEVSKEEKKEDEEISQPKYKLKIELPEQLTRCLINDFNFIINKQFLTIVPADISIKQMFEEYLINKGSEEQIELEYNGLTEFVKGLKDYVDEMLGFQLLYRSEKLQYKLIKEQHPNIPLHELYGPIHMLRVITRLEVAFNTLLLSPKSIKLIDFYLKDFLKYLVENYEKYFNKDLYDGICHS